MKAMRIVLNIMTIIPAFTVGCANSEDASAEDANSSAAAQTGGSEQQQPTLSSYGQKSLACYANHQNVETPLVTAPATQSCISELNAATFKALSTAESDSKYKAYLAAVELACSTDDYASKVHCVTSAIVVTLPHTLEWALLEKVTRSWLQAESLKAFDDLSRDGIESARARLEKVSNANLREAKTAQFERGNELCQVLPSDLRLACKSGLAEAL